MIYRDKSQEYESEEDEEETAQEKRVRLAKKYLQQIKEEGKILIKYLLNAVFGYILILLL